MPTILAIESATDACSVALLVEGQGYEDFRVEPRRHTRLLLPMIDGLLRQHRVGIGQLDAIAYSAGPGSFTGLRVCAGTVQGLAFAAQCPVLPLSTLAILAQTCANHLQLDDGSRILPAMDARMDEIYWGDYQLRGGLVEANTNDALLAPAAVKSGLTSAQSVIGVGNGWQFHNDFALAVLPQHIDAAMLPRAQAMLALAERCWRDGGAVSPDQAVPVYLRESVAWT